MQNHFRLSETLCWSMPKKCRRKGGRFTPKRVRFDLEDVCRLWGCLGDCGKVHLWLPFTRSLAKGH